MGIVHAAPHGLFVKQLQWKLACACECGCVATDLQRQGLLHVAALSQLEPEALQAEPADWRFV